VIPPSGEQITIAARDQEAVVVEVGGGLRSYSVGGRELVDGYRADEMSSSGRGQVLIPWPNRLEDGLRFARQRGACDHVVHSPNAGYHRLRYAASTVDGHHGG
jgi:galactose mutarotase-like enzyme